MVRLGKMIQEPMQWAGKQYVKDPALVTNTITSGCFGLFSVGQAVAISKSNKIPREQKDFLVPQSLAEGALRVGITFSLAQATKRAGELMLEKAKIMPKEIPQKLKNADALQKVVNPKVTTRVKSEMLDVAPETINKITKFHKGLSLLSGTLLGTVLGLNVVTPFVRNKFASWL